MNHFIAGILRIVLLEASVGLLLLARVVRSDDKPRTRKLNSPATSPNSSSKGQKPVRQLSQ